MCARPGDARGGFWRVSSTAHRPRPVDARAAASAASSKSAPPSWGAPGERRVDVVGDGSIRVSEACVSAECWASTRALDERVAHDRLSAAVESDVNFVDAGVPPPDVRGDARFARWLRRRGGRREDLVVGGHLSRGAFAPRESDDEAERTVSAVDLKRAYRDVDDAIDRLLLSTGADWIDVLHVPWLAAAPESLRGRRRFERIVSYPLAKDGSRTNVHSRVANEFTNKKGVHEEAFTTAMDALRWVPLASVDGEKKQNQKQNALLVPTRVSSSSSSSSSSAAEARFAAIREAHRRALCDAVRRGKVRTLCVSFETPWDACGLELGDAALYEPSELAELWSASGPDANQNAHSSQKKTPKRRDGAGSLFLGDAVAGVSLSLSALRDPRLESRGDDYEATLERWCKPPGFGEEDSFSFERRERRLPVVAARGVFFPDASPLLPAQNANSTEARRASEALLASSMVRAASAFGDFTREDVALGLARARGYAACVAMGAVSSAAATSAMDDETFAARLASFALRELDDDLNMHLDAACLAAVDAARLRHFKGASDAERGKGRGRGRGRDPFEELDEDEKA